MAHLLPTLELLRTECWHGDDRRQVSRLRTEINAVARFGANPLEAMAQEAMVMAFATEYSSLNADYVAELRTALMEAARLRLEEDSRQFPYSEAPTTVDFLVQAVIWKRSDGIEALASSRWANVRLLYAVILLALPQKSSEFLDLIQLCAPNDFYLLHPIYRALILQRFSGSTIDGYYVAVLAAQIEPVVDVGR